MQIDPEWAQLIAASPQLALALYVAWQLQQFRVELRAVHDRMLDMLGKALDESTDSMRRPHHGQVQ